MQRIRTTIELAKASWEVLKADKELLLLPVISAIASIIVAVTFLVPMFIATGVEDLGALQYVVFFVLYFFLSFVTIFFNTALVHAAIERLNGGDPTLSSAIAGARARVPQIIPWALVSATVSLILRAIEERAGFIGQIVSSIAGLAWALVTFLVIPVYVAENVGVRDAVKRSGELFKQTWGENVAAQVGFGLLGFLAVLPVVPLVALGAAAGSIGLGLTIVIAVAWVAVVMVTLAALNGIFQAALYHYAVAGDVPGGFFSKEDFSHAFVPRKGRGGFGGRGIV